MRYVLACLAIALGAGCPDRSLSALAPAQAGATTKNIAVSAELDLLFVIDDSASTKDKQELFAQNFHNFVATLQALSPRPNLHIGVVTSSVDLGVGIDQACHPTRGADGVLQNASRDPAQPCMATGDRYLVDVARPDGSRMINYTEPLDQALTCIAHVGDNGCGFEAPLEAMKRALDGSRPDNAGFLRPGAFLAVVILTDEDDCSADPQLFRLAPALPNELDFRCAREAYRCDQPISPTAPGAYTGCTVRHDGLLIDPRSYAQFLSGLQGPSRVAVAVIAGDPVADIRTGPIDMPFTQPLALEPSCHATINGAYAIGRPAIRIDEFRASFGDRGLFESVCQSDYSQAVAAIGALVTSALSPCLEGTLDTRDIDPASPGLQLDCAVSDLQGADSDAQVEEEIPRCHMVADDQPDLAGGRACWWVRSNPACATETQLELRVERTAAPPSSTTVRVTCAVAPT